MDDKEQSIVIPDQLRLVRENLALEIEEVASILSLQKEQLESWERGLSEPSVEQLGKLAKFYCRSIEFFLTPTPGLPSQISFRETLQKRRIKDLTLTLRKILVQFDELCRAGKELETLLERPRKIKIERITIKQKPEEIAYRERERLGLKDEPIEDLRNLLEEQGVRVFELPILGDESSGASWWHQDYGPCILINARDTRGRRNFTLAHEYAHLLISDLPVLCGAKLDTLDIPIDYREEYFANKFAATFLIPTEDLRRSFFRRRKPVSLKLLINLAQRYKASLEVVGRRLEELKLLPKGITDSFIAEREKERRFFPPKPPTWLFWLKEVKYLPTTYLSIEGRKRKIKIWEWLSWLGQNHISQALEAYSKGFISIGKLAYYLQLDIGSTMQIVKRLPR